MDPMLSAGSGRRDSAPRQHQQGDEARADELNKLRLALATFAVHLDAFELRASGAVRAAGVEPRRPLPFPNPSKAWKLEMRGSNGGDDWASTKSVGSKPDT
jgi:hypothetical protein